MSQTTAKLSLTHLNREIEQVEEELARLRNERKVVAKDAARAARQLRYLQWARLIRKPTASFDAWPVLVLLVGPLIVGILFFVIIDLIFVSFGLAALAFLVGITAGALALASLLYRPSNALLEPAIADAETHYRLENARLSEKIQRITEVNEQLKRLIEERRDQVASGKLQRAALLQRNWKSMRGTEWEDFVVEVLRTQGATVQRNLRPGNDDPNLIVDFGPRRIAIFTEGEGQTVSSETIRKALAAKDRHRCDACAVIMNRRFTGAAQDFAARNGCTIIGTSEFPDFVLGEIEL